MGYGWGGFSNGQIPYDAMVYCRGAWLEPTAAYWAEAMGQVFERERGRPLMFLGYSEGFRVFGEWSDFDNGVRNTQTYYYMRKQRNPSAPAAAYPGGSIHGWALAVDVDLTHLDEDDIDWLHTRGRAFGWNWDTTGRPNDEPWHLDFNLDPTEPFDPNPAPAPKPKKKEDPTVIIVSSPSYGQISVTDSAGAFPIDNSTGNAVFLREAYPATDFDDDKKVEVIIAEAWRRAYYDRGQDAAAVAAKVQETLDSARK